MAPRLARAKRELQDALSTLEPQESFSIIAFCGKTRLFSRKLLTATPDSLAVARAFVDNLQLGPGTNLEKAMKSALAMRDANVIVVVTDGVPTYGETDFTKLARRVRDLNRAQARIFTVGLVGKNPDGTDQSFEASTLLKQIAADSGGQARVASIDDPTYQPAGAPGGQD
jgi:hypothetical protein